MHFLVPAFLAGLLAVALPVVVHLIGGRKARVVPFAALEFLLASRRRLARRLRLRRLLLLVLRAGAVAAIALVLAKPYREAAALGSDVAAGPQSAVIVLDDSMSMQYRLGGESLFERAKSRAVQIAGQIGPQSEVALVLASAGTPAPAAELSSDRSRVLRAIQGARVTDRATDLTSALRRAQQILATAPHAERDVYLVGDLCAHGLTQDAVAVLGGPHAPALHLVDAADGAPLPNLAVVKARVEPAPVLGPRGVRVTADIANFSDAPVADVTLTLDVDGRALARGFVDVAARGTSEKELELALPEGLPGAVGADVALPPDALPIDDRRYFRVAVRREIKVLLVDGDPRTERREDELFYLGAALAPDVPSGPDDAVLSTTSTTPDDLARHPLDGFDAVFLVNVKTLPAEEVSAIDDYVHAGGGLFLALGENVDPQLYDDQLAPLLPQPLGTAHSASGVGETGAGEGGAERIGHLDERHPVFAVFPSGAASLRSARFFRYMLLAPTAESADRRVLATFESGAPLLVEGKKGKGRVLLFTSTLDRDWTDLPIRPGYLPLLQQSVRYLAHAPLPEADTPVVVGRAHEIPLHGGEAELEVTPPSNQPVTYEADALAGRSSISFTGTAEPGLYRVAARTAAEGAVRDRPADLFAVNVDPAESDTARAKPALLAQRSGGDQAKPPPRRIPLWNGLAAVLLLFLLGEALITART